MEFEHTIFQSTLIDGARSHDGGFRELISGDLLTQPFSSQKFGGRLRISSGSREVNISDDILLLGDFGNFAGQSNIGVMVSLIVIVSIISTDQIDNNIGIGNCSFNSFVFAEIKIRDQMGITQISSQFEIERVPSGSLGLASERIDQLRSDSTNFLSNILANVASSTEDGSSNARDRVLLALVIDMQFLLSIAFLANSHQTAGLDF
mmetsp:Transcript_57322/g.65358  ORF Transcript_57322/g.65358 Transcript_57322/m.65358 type:complete len:206 (+) Transcript_57322:632-1249(+)